jgi:membrane protease YdiL (CAAX protease family)
MSGVGGADAGTAARSILLLCAAVICFATFFAVDPFVGTGFLVLLVLVAPPPGVGYRPLRAGSVLAHYVPFALVWVALATAYLHVMVAIGHPIEPQPALLQLMAGEQSGLALLRQVTLVVVLAPIAEEILFRGYLFTAVSLVAPMWLTQVVTATLFGLVHGLAHALPIGVLSLLFGYLRQRHRSLLPSMLAHAVHNGVTLALLLTWPGLLNLFYNR